MEQFLAAIDLTLPLANPVLKFLLILVVILLVPLLLNPLRVPPLLGLIIAGAIIGPNGINLMERDSGIILSGTAGLLYIMFLAGLEIDIADFKKNSRRSIVFGSYTFVIPMVLGMLASLYILNLKPAPAVLLASMFASHTLIAYPMLSRLGVAKNRAVNITVGGTLITDTLALLVLAVIVGLSRGAVTPVFWMKLLGSLLVFGAVVLLIFPLIGRWFIKRFDDSVSQYIFVLAMVFMGAVLAELAGIEAIIGAFLSGLALNRLIPHTSALMNRIDFVGNAIFIPFFLIGVGMLIDYRAFIDSWETLKVAIVMTVVATLAKFLAAWFTQKTYKFSRDERHLIFGLSNAQAAATLAAVLVGYNIITGTDANGEPIRLLGEDILNGTIVMILVTCTIASFVAQKGAKNIALLEQLEPEAETSDYPERVLIPISNLDTTDELINLSITVKTGKNREGLYALHVIPQANSTTEAEKQARKILDKAVTAAAATDHNLHSLLRYDQNPLIGISNVAKEHSITDIILGLHHQKNLSDTFLGSLTEGVLSRCQTTTLIYKPVQPLGTIKRHIVAVPPGAEEEAGFGWWLVKVWNIARNTGAVLQFYASANTLTYIKLVHEKHPVPAEFNDFNDWEDFLILAREVRKDDNLIAVMSRPGFPSFQEAMEKVPAYLNKYFKAQNFMLIYPLQYELTTHRPINLKNASFLEPLEKGNELAKTLVKLFNRK
jgi:Kef-type K+ transport system membrane component KefB/nucleotide-binding universal stress UspA family protein